MDAHDTNLTVTDCEVDNYIDDLDEQWNESMSTMADSAENIYYEDDEPASVPAPVLQVPAPQACAPVVADAPVRAVPAIVPPVIPVAGEWQKPVEIQPDLLPVQPFRPEMLPKALRSLAVDLSESLQTPLDFAAVFYVLALSASLNRRGRIRPKAVNKWTLVPNLWGLLIGVSGLLKTGVTNACVASLREIENEYYEEWLTACELAKKKLGKRLKDDPTLMPKRRRVLISNSTPEATEKINSENQAGIFQIRDEIAGLIADLSKPGRESQRQMMLELWNGDAPILTDRVGPNSAYGKYGCLGLGGSIQPDVLLRNAGEQKTCQRRIFMQRMQLMVWPDVDREFVYVDRMDDEDAAWRFEMLVRSLEALDPEEPLWGRFAEGEAQSSFIEWYVKLNKRTRGQNESSLISQHLSKYNKLMPVLGLIFELADLSMVDGFSGFTPGDTIYVSLANTELAIEWCDYLESHARRVYGVKATPEFAYADRVCKEIKTEKYRRKRELQSQGPAPQEMAWHDHAGRNPQGHTDTRCTPLVAPSARPCPETRRGRSGTGITLGSQSGCMGTGAGR